jgi:hypothetical protein
MESKSGIVEVDVSAPSWIRALAERCCGAIEPDAVFGGLGCRYYIPDSVNNPSPTWQLIMYPSPNEAFGGKADGKKMFVGFVLDIADLIAAFSRVDELVWESPLRFKGNLDGPNLQIGGEYAGYPVRLSLYSVPPSNEDAALQVNVHTGEFWTKEAVQR